jgi:hypothetical protein
VDVFEWWRCPSSELSHSIFASAISQVSRIERSESFRYFLRTGIDEAKEIAPIASAACVIHEYAEVHTLGETYFVPDYGVFLLIREHVLEGLERCCILHLPQDIS